MGGLFRLESDSEDYVFFDVVSGELSVSEDASSERSYLLSRREAVSLASVLLQFGTGKGVVS